MDSIIQDDFAEFLNKEEMFKSSAKLYNSNGGTLVFDGDCIFDKKPQPLQNEDGSIIYSGHVSIVTFSMNDLLFMTNYFSLKGYYVEVTTNKGTFNYMIESSVFNSNVNAIYCDYLKEVV